MNPCRVTVEWGFKEMTTKWAFVSINPQQKLLMNPVGVQYRVATFFRTSTPARTVAIRFDSTLACCPRHCGSTSKCKIYISLI